MRVKKSVESSTCSSLYLPCDSRRCIHQHITRRNATRPQGQQSGHIRLRRDACLSDSAPKVGLAAHRSLHSDSAPFHPGRHPPMGTCTHLTAYPLAATRHQQLLDIPVALKRGAQRGTILRFYHVCSTDTNTRLGSEAPSPSARARQSTKSRGKQEQTLDARRTGLDDNDARSHQLVVIGGKSG